MSVDIAKIEENISDLERCKEDSEVVEIIEECFKEDPFLKFEVYREGVCFSYSDLSSSLSHMYITNLKDENKILISQMYPYWYDKGFRPYDKMTRMIVSTNGWGNVISMFRDRVVESGEINPETERPILKSVPSKVARAESIAKGILPRAEVYLNMLLELKKLSPRYNGKIEHFRGNISMCGDCDKYIPIWESLRNIRMNGFLTKNLDFKNADISELPRYNHLPKIVFDS